MQVKKEAENFLIKLIDLFFKGIFIVTIWKSFIEKLIVPFWGNLLILKIHFV